MRVSSHGFFLLTEVVCLLKLFKSQLDCTAFRAMVDGTERFPFSGLIIHVTAEAAAVDRLELMIVIDVGIASHFMEVIHCIFDVESVQIL